MAVDGVKAKLASVVVNFHQKKSHSNRVRILADLITAELKTLVPLDNEVEGLDIGCGDMEMNALISEKLPNINWQCIDVFPKPASENPKWGKYTKFDGLTIPFESKRFKVAILSDVLHHAEDDMDILLKDTARTADIIIIKDHIEYGFVSRQLLRMMDFIGNWGYGVNVPKKYFTEKGFKGLCDRCGVTIAKMEIGIHLYDHLPLIKKISKPKWQFLAVLSS